MTSRYVFLDSMRGLAALSVLLSYFVGAYGLVPMLGWIENSPFHIAYDGFAAVSLFFVLSGFVLSLRLLQGEGNERPIEYLLSRFFRIFPPFLGVLLLSAGLSLIPIWFPPTVPEATEWVKSFWSPPFQWDVLISQAQFHVPDQGHPNYLPQAWTLGVELLLSSLIPFLVVFSKKGKTWLGTFLVLLLFFFNASDYLIHFTLGMLLAQHWESAKSRLNQMGKIGKWTMLLLGLALYTYRFTFPSYAEALLGHPLVFFGANRTIWFVTGVGALVLIALVCASASLQRFLQWRLFGFFGRVSYSLYLVHFSVLITCVPWTIRLANSWGWSELPSLGLGLAGLILGTVAVSATTHKYLERPSIKVGKAMIAWMRKAKS